MNQDNMKKPRVPEAILIAILLAVSLAMAGCVIEPPANVDCDCPNLERIVGTLNWLPGHPNYEVSTPSRRYDEPRKRARVTILTNSPEDDIKQIAQQLQKAGLEYDEATRQAVTEDLTIALFASSGTIDGSPVLNVSIGFAGTDHEAERIFAPLIDTLGFKNATESG